MTHEQYTELKKHFTLVTIIDVEPGVYERNSFPCLKFTPSEKINSGLGLYDEKYLGPVIKLGTRNPWNFAQFLVAFYPGLVERL